VVCAKAQPFTWKRHKKVSEKQGESPSVGEENRTTPQERGESVGAMVGPSQRRGRGWGNGVPGTTSAGISEKDAGEKRGREKWTQHDRWRRADLAESEKERYQPRKPKEGWGRRMLENNTGRAGVRPREKQHQLSERQPHRTNEERGGTHKSKFMHQDKQKAPPVSSITVNFYSSWSTGGEWESRRELKLLRGTAEKKESKKKRSALHKGRHSRWNGRLQRRKYACKRVFAWAREVARKKEKTSMGRGGIRVGSTAQPWQISDKKTYVLGEREDLKCENKKGITFSVGQGQWGDRGA